MKKTRMKALEVTFADSLSQTCRLLFDVNLFWVDSWLPTAVVPVSLVGMVFVSIVRSYWLVQMWDTWNVCEEWWCSKSF